MKKKTFLVALIIMAICCFSACSGTGSSKSSNFSKALAGQTYATYHWYFNETDGNSGYFTDETFYTWVFNEEGTEFSVSAQDGSFSAEGTLDWTSDAQADVYLDSGQYWTAEFSYSTSYPDYINLMIQETNFVYVLEPAE